MDGRRSAMYAGAAIPAWVLAVSGSAVLAQDTGTLRFNIDPAASYVFVVDHRFRMQQREVELAAGAHHFSFWAPQRRVVDTTLTIVGGRTTEFSMRLPFSLEYLVYQRDLKAYRKDMRMMRLVPAAATGCALVYTAFKYVDMKKAHDVLERDRSAYADAASPHAITVLKTETMPADKDAFSKARSSFAVATGITALCAGTTAYLYMRSAKRPKPVFNDAEKLRFDGLSWMPDADGGDWVGGITWHFTR